MKKLMLFILLLNGLYLVAAAQDMSKMKTYYLVLLKKGPNRSQDSATAASIQTAHLAHISKMAADGKLAMAGPCPDESDLRGIFIFNVGSMEEAKMLTEADPAVKAGRLIMEIHPWMSERGVTLP
jgi:uncharacterized protein